MALYVFRTLMALDKEARILAAISQDGINKISVTPIEMCRGHLSATLYSQITATYEGIVAARRQMEMPGK